MSSNTGLLKVCTLLVSSALVVGACRTLDLNEPVALASDGLTGPHLEALRQAATCWNRGFGIDFRVVDSADDVSQVVEVFYDDLTCLVGSAEYQIGSPRAVSICRDAFDARGIFSVEPFDVLLHELGHVANIFGHGGSGVTAEGGVRRAGQVLFTSTDRQRFVKANPSFRSRSECELVRTESTETAPNALACSCPD